MSHPIHSAAQARATRHRPATRVPALSVRARAVDARGPALRRLEREHVALLLAIAELESGAPGSQSAPLRAALAPLLRADLARAQYALRRAAAGQYGVCDRCGRALAPRLLELNPATTRCPACSTHRRTSNGAA